MALLDRLNFFEKVPTERKTLSNIENANDANESENEEPIQEENSFNTEKESNEGTRETTIDSAVTSATEVNIEKTASEPPRKKKKLSQKNNMQEALQYWKERDTERRAQMQALLQQTTLNQGQETDVDGIKS